LTLTIAPPAGAAVTMDASALWLCRFNDDALSLEQFAYNLFRSRRVKLTTVKL
jgi:hypothetical protein